MQYALTFLEGLISCIPPCMLPMLPIYIIYFAGEKNTRKRIFPRAVSFVGGFTVVFCLLGVLAGTVGEFLHQHQTAVNIVTGIIVILFGLSYLEIFPMEFRLLKNPERQSEGLYSPFFLGMIFSVNLSPCVGAFLGSALMLAASVGGVWRGLLLLIVYSLGLGVPLVISAVLIDKLKGAFTFIKKHYTIINTVCGIFLMLTGLLMCFGLLDKLFKMI